MSCVLSHHVLLTLQKGMFPLKAFYWGQKGARENFTLQIQNIVENGYRSLGETPVIIGECGIPMDMKYVFSLINLSFY
jgi:hypothetical protein